MSLMTSNGQIEDVSIVRWECIYAKAVEFYLFEQMCFHVIYRDYLTRTSKLSNNITLLIQ